MSGARVVVSSCSVMPQSAAYLGSMEMMLILLMVEKMLNCENLVMPVMKQHLMSGSNAFRF